MSTRLQSPTSCRPQGWHIIFLTRLPDRIVTKVCICSFVFKDIYTLQSMLLVPDMSSTIRRQEPTEYFQYYVCWGTFELKNVIMNVFNVSVLGYLLVIWNVAFRASVLVSCTVTGHKAATDVKCQTSQPWPSLFCQSFRGAELSSKLCGVIITLMTALPDRRQSCESRAVVFERDTGFTSFSADHYLNVYSDLWAVAHVLGAVPVWPGLTSTYWFATICLCARVFLCIVCVDWRGSEAAKWLCSWLVGWLVGTNVSQSGCVRPVSPQASGSTGFSNVWWWRTLN